MNTILIKGKILTSIIVLLLIIGCSEKFLELDNPNQVTTLKFWQTQTDLEQGIAATYKMLSEESDGSYYMRTNPQLTEGKTENYTVSTDVIGRYEIGSYVNTMSNNNTAQIFRAQYRGIFRANQVIQYAPQIKDITEELRNTIVGEAKFLRGLYYFHLVNEFGSVPITTALVQTDEDYFKERSPIEDVWTQIISDWNDAETVLPIAWSSEWIGRATKGAVIAFKGRAYLYQGKWTEAIAEYEKIVNSEATYGYALMPNYAALWDGQHRNSIESIFEVQYSRNKADVWGGRTASSTVYAQEVCANEAGGWEEILPTKTLLAAMTQELTADGDFDPRAKATIAWNYPGCVYYTMNFDSLYTEEETETGLPVIHNRKNCNWWNKNEGDWRSDLNEIPMRFADVLLGLAEAYTQNNQVDKAAPLVHRIRTRANLADKLAVMSGWSKTEMMTEIMHQRNVEFAREFVHFFDLRRWGTLEQVITDSKELGWDNYEPRNEYYPIPEAELNANPKMTQNPAWM
jgi:starch-binding outer membrane protein, SusD/RagB family